MRNLSLKEVIFLTAACLIFNRCAAPQKMKVVIKMMPVQEEHFKKQVIPKFEKEHNVKIEVESLDNIADLSNYLREADKTGGVHLAKVPFEMTRTLIGKNLIIPLDSIVGQKEINDLKSEYFLMDLVRINKMYYYFPRKFETRMLLYLKSHVREAVQNWDRYKVEINETLKKHNGYGLPQDYLLESNPNEWDYFDIFVVGYYWKSREIGGKKVPRIAHRAKNYSGTSLRLMDRAYQLGANSTDILRTDSPEIVDVFMWEALYAQENIYNPRMYQEGWSGSDIWKGFQSGDVFLSFMTQIDAFFVHGAGTKAMPGFLENPEDMGVAVMPKGVSLVLEEGKPMREGGRGITTGGWWWGIPSNTPSRELSYKLAHHITNTENQIEGCSNFGMVPVRQDMLSELGLMFGGGWISDVFHVASQQLVENRFTVIPLVDEYPEVGKNYRDAFYDISIKGNTGENNKIDFDYISNLLKTKYVPMQKEVLKGNYPRSKIEKGMKPKTSQKFKGLNKDLE